MTTSGAVAHGQVEAPMVPDLPDAPVEAEPPAPPLPRKAESAPRQAEERAVTPGDSASVPAVVGPALVVEAPPPAPSAVVPPAAPAAFPGLRADEPLAGFSDGSAFLRSPDNSFILFPSGRLQLDGYFFQGDDKKVPKNTFLIRRARLETTGWIGGRFYFSLAGDFAVGAPSAPAATAAQANVATTDVFITYAPLETLLMIQFGQFDAPFTLENRTSDKYFDFMERSITVRAFGVPTNKEIGAMAYGYNAAKNFHYSLGVFNGDGQNYKNVDSQFDLIGRAWIAPFSFGGDGPLHDVELGASYWRGDKANTLAPPNQSTQGGLTFLSFNQYNVSMNGNTVPVQLRQVGLLNALAGEVNVPVMHRFGVRSEFVWKESSLSEVNVPSSGAAVILGGANLKGWSTYVEAWFWAIGDDRIIGDQQGLEPLSRLKKFGVTAPRDGLMLAFRAEVLREEVSLEPDADVLNLKDSAVGQTKVTSYELGINYWHSKRFRATFNYVFNHIAGDTAQIKALAKPNEQEFLFRLGIAL